MNQQARLDAVEELMIEILQSDLARLERLNNAADGPIRVVLAGDRSENARQARAHQLTVRAAKRQLLQQAKYSPRSPNEPEAS